MHIHRLLTITALLIMASALPAGPASAQAGAACLPTVCGLGGQMRIQSGNDVPRPISLAPDQGASGTFAVPTPFTAITIQTAPFTFNGIGGLPFVGQGLGQTGQIKPTPSATIMQTTAPGTGPRQLTLPPGAFHYDGSESIPVVAFRVRNFAIQTEGVHDFPHPGTTALGAPAFTEENQTVAIPTPNANVFFAGGRIGAATVTYYADATASGSPTNNYGHGVPPTAPPTIHDGLNGSPPLEGIARFTATGNQFGGQAIARVTGTTRVYMNGGSLNPPVDLPCKVSATPAEGTTAQGVFVPFNTGPDCQFSLSIIDHVGSGKTAGVAGGAFNGLVVHSPYQTSTGVFTGTIGFNGTIIGQGSPVTVSGMGVPFTGLGSHGVGFPATTGRLTISVHSNVMNGTGTSRFIRSGTDARDAAGNGVVVLVTGSLTARGDPTFGGFSDRTWITLEIPEPSAGLAAFAGLFALFACHQITRRRS